MSELSGAASARAYLSLMRMDRPIGAFLLLWPTLWALWLAGDGAPPASIVLIFIAGTFAMRAAGCVINDYADRNFDGHVARTKDRPLASGILTPRQALVTFGLLLALALILVLQLNAATVKLSLFGALIATLYPFAKRVTHLPQLVLGIAFSWGIPMAFTAITGEAGALAWAVFAANFAWIVAYDTQYAMADRDDDLKIGVKSTAILFGKRDNLIVGILHLTTLALMAVIGAVLSMNPAFYLGLVAAGMFAGYQQWLCRSREPAHCFRAFLNNNWFGAMVFAGLLLGELPW